MKQITIYELLPLLKRGWVAMDSEGTWWWYEEKPNIGDCGWCSTTYSYCVIDMDGCFLNISPFKGDWKESLRRVK